MNALERINANHHSFEIYRINGIEKSRFARRSDGTWFFLDGDFYTNNVVTHNFKYDLEERRHEMDNTESGLSFVDSENAPKCSLCAALCCKPWDISLTQEERRATLFRPFVNIKGQIIKPCPFLTVSNSCSIYEDRPFGCRRYDCRVDKRNANVPSEPRNANDMKEEV